MLPSYHLGMSLVSSLLLSREKRKEGGGRERKLYLEFEREAKKSRKSLRDVLMMMMIMPGADDNSYILIYSVHIHLKTRPECGTSLNMTPAPCYIKFTNVLTPAPITHGDMPAAPIRG